MDCDGAWMQGSLRSWISTLDSRYSYSIALDVGVVQHLDYISEGIPCVVSDRANTRFSWRILVRDTHQEQLGEKT